MSVAKDKLYRFFEEPVEVAEEPAVEVTPDGEPVDPEVPAEVVHPETDGEATVDPPVDDDTPETP